MAVPALGQETAETGAMRLYIQQLEERIRQLTGENERLTYELNQARAQGGSSAPANANAEAFPAAPPGSSPRAAVGSQNGLAAPPQDIGSLSISPDDPLISSDGAGAGEPIDLSTLARGIPAPGQEPGETDEHFEPPEFGAGEVSGSPGQQPRTAALSGSSRDEYDLAYGYVLTGDYALAEESFKNWLAAFPDDLQAPDAQFWLGESHFQQREFREAANAFLAVYKMGQLSAKGPDALLKLGMSLAALGETNAACATFGEVGTRYPQASAALMSRVNEEVRRAHC